MINNYILVLIEDVNKFYLLNYLNRNNINYELKKEKDNDIYIKIYESDFEKLKYLLKRKKIIKYYGYKGIVKFIKNNIIFLISSIYGIFFLYLLSNVIFEIKINIDDENIKTILLEELEKKGIKKYSFKKNYEEKEKIKKELLEENSELIEWLEINELGVTYIIELNKNIKKNKIIEIDKPCHIVASKDAIIKHIESSNGNVEKEINDYVKKGDIIINGNIFKGEDIKNVVHAKGKVYGEVWYTSKVIIPFEYREYEKMGEIINHYYLELFGNKMTIIGKFETNNYMSKKQIILNKPYLFLKVYKEEKELYEYKDYKINKKEAIKEAIKRSDKSINNSLKEDEYIISKNVLNIYTYSSKIELEMFYKVYENITEYLEIEEEGDVSEG